MSALFNGKWLENITSLWFLWSILAFSIVLGISVKTTDKVWLRIVFVVIGWFATSLFPGAAGNIYLYPYFLFGYWIARYDIRFDQVDRRTVLIGLITTVFFFLFLANYQKRHFIYISGIIGNGYSLSESLLIDVFRWGIGFAGCICFIVFNMVVYKHLHIKSLVKYVCIGCKVLGIYSLEVYALSVSLLSAYLPMISRIVLINLMKFNPASHLFIYDWIITPMIAVAYSLLLVWLSKILYRIRIGQFIFGYGRNGKR